jgi:uncharacterized protein (DUF1778 family)
MSKKKKKQMGRPQLPAGEAKDVIVQTRVSESDRRLLQGAADSAGCKLADWIRQRILAAAKAEQGNR